MAFANLFTHGLPDRLTWKADEHSHTDQLGGDPPATVGGGHLAEALNPVSTSDASAQRALNGIHSLDLHAWREVFVDIEGQRRRRVTKPRLHDLDRGPVAYEKAS